MGIQQNVGDQRSAVERVNKWLSARPHLRGLVRSGVQRANAPVAKARLHRELSRVNAPIRLEIGGHNPRAGWLVTNVNAITRLYLDATRQWPMETNSVECIFSDNVIEHIPLDAARKMLLEAHRCLRPGGVIRTVTPDLRAHVDMYLAGEDVETNDVAKHYREIGMTVEYPVDLIRIPVAAFGHHAGYLYDFDTLAAELRRAGFTNVVRRELGQSDHDSLRNLDLRGHEGGAQLAVEATA